MGSASLVFWCRTARSRRSGHQCSLRTILRELCVTAPCRGEDVSVAVEGLVPCGTGHFISFDIVAPTSSVRLVMVSAALCFLARGADSDDVDGVAFRSKASGQPLRRGKDAEVLFFDVGDGLAMRTDHVVVEVAIQLDPERTVVHADFFQHAPLDEEMNVFVHRGEGDCRYTLLDPR